MNAIPGFYSTDPVTTTTQKTRHAAGGWRFCRCRISGDRRRANALTKRSHSYGFALPSILG
jgi:hypothetical protein